MAGSVVVSDGVSKTVLSPGSGPEVKKGNTITVHCTGILAESNKKFWRFANQALAAVPCPKRTKPWFNSQIHKN